MTGIDHIAAAFGQAEREDRAALMPYLPLGYPTPAVLLELVQAASAAGADLLELGIPFSDPLADGPTIQRATHVALQQGMTVRRCLESVEEVRARGVTIPLLLMGYYNPILSYGEDAFCRRCRAAGADGLIVPDLPPEESESLERACRENGLALVHLLAPTSPPGRIRMVAARAQGFIYLVTVTGVTGARDALPPDLTEFVARVRNATDTPLAVGFGISTPAQARRVAEIADGVIVGSAIVRRAGAADRVQQVESFISELRAAMARGRKEES